MYGSGLLSSYGEIAHAIESPEVQRFPIQLEWAINQSFEIHHYQPLLFIVDSFDHLFSLVDQLESWMKAGKLNNVAPGEPGVNEQDLRSFLHAGIAQVAAARILRHNKHVRLLAICMFLSAAAVAQTAGGADAWKTSPTLGYVDISGLTATQKRAVLKLMREQDCSCQCGMKGAECIMKDPNCSYSRRLRESRFKASKMASRCLRSAS